MIRPDPNSDEPEPQAKIWRYMDFSKFISLLHRQALFFPQAKNLGDSFEGSVRSMFDEAEVGGELRQALEKNYESGPRLNTAISCWHLSEYQSVAMWKLYLSSNEGITVQSTVERLESSLSFPESARVNAGKVIYGSARSFSGRLTLTPDDMFFFKRASYEHEKEFRLLIRLNESNLNELGGYMCLPSWIYLSRKCTSPRALHLGLVTWLARLRKTNMRSKRILSDRISTQGHCGDIFSDQIAVGVPCAAFGALLQT